VSARAEVAGGGGRCSHVALPAGRPEDGTAAFLIPKPTPPIDPERERAVREAVEAAAAQWEQRLLAARSEGAAQAAELQDEVVRLRSAAEASLRSGGDDVSGASGAVF
jgi:hypothetical protein